MAEVKAEIKTGLKFTMIINGYDIFSRFEMKK